MPKADIVTLKFHISENRNSQRDSFVSLLFNLLLSAFAFSGFGGVFCITFNISVNAPPVLFCACISSAFLLLPLQKLRIIASFIPAASAIIINIFFWTYTANGFVYTSNRILNTIGCKFSIIMPQLEKISEKSADERISVTLFFITISVLISYAVAFSIKHNDIIIPIIPAIPSVLFCIIFEGAPPLIFVCLSALYVLGVFFKKLSGSLVSIFSLISCTIICALCILIFSASGIGNNYNGNFFNHIKNQILNEINDLRYGKSNVMTEGNFSDLKPFEPQGKKQLEVLMSNPDSLYLRGFIGEVYDKNGWHSLDSEQLYESSDLFYWLHKKSFYGQTQLASAAGLSQDFSDNINKITVNNKGASRKYIYAPYEVLTADNDILRENGIGDSSLISAGLKGNEFYSFNSAENQVKQFPEILKSIKGSDSPKTSEYLNNESHYRKFVYNSYLDIPDHIKNILENQLGKYDSDKNGRLDYSTAQQKILSFLSSKVTYNANASFSENNIDFIQYFLEQSCEGYSVHYATAAALMFRYYGIPARYTEGFLITPEDTEHALSNSPINIDDSHFHAWVEFYRDGIGWIPFETTPPYLDVMEKAEDIAPLPDNDNPPDNDNNRTSDNEENIRQCEIKSSEIEENHRSKYIITIITALISAALMFFILICILKRLKLYKKLKSFERSDNKTSVIMTFAFIVNLLIITKHLENENQLYISDSSLYNKRDNLSNDMKLSLSIYDKAKFSNHKISDDEKQLVLSLMSNVVERIKSESSWIKNTANRFIRCIYK